MTQIVHTNSPNLEEWAIRYFLKSLSDRDPATQLSAHFTKTSQFADILEKAARMVENKKIERKNIGAGRQQLL